MRGASALSMENFTGTHGCSSSPRSWASSSLDRAPPLRRVASPIAKLVRGQSDRLSGPSGETTPDPPRSLGLAGWSNPPLASWIRLERPKNQASELDGTPANEGLFV